MVLWSHHYNDGLKDRHPRETDDDTSTIHGFPGCLPRVLFVLTSFLFFLNLCSFFFSSFSFFSFFFTDFLSDFLSDSLQMKFKVIDFTLKVWNERSGRMISLLLFFQM